ncbi:MAG: hypothetical protein Q8873_08900 [Bacillota bacterium]|nr:hypothetical protein [Bacillota bacterium]
MPLLNYTTSINVHKTLGEIQGCLVEHGARKLFYDYKDNKSIDSLSFTIITPRGEVGVKLPAKVEAVLKILQTDSKVPKNLKTYEQAERVAWRIILEWVKAQMAILETEMVKLEQIFLPYLVNNSGQTFFEAYENGQLQISDGR